MGLLEEDGLLLLKLLLRLHLAHQASDLLGPERLFGEEVLYKEAPVTADHWYRGPGEQSSGFRGPEGTKFAINKRRG